MSASSSSSDAPLVCSRCATRHPLSERFCPHCEMPLAYAGREPDRQATELHDRARKVDPRYVGGDLVQVATARHQAEAELIQSLLLDEGIPSIMRRSAAFDVPDFLAAGPRDILVAQAGEQAAREMLHEAEILEPGTSSGVAVPARLRVAGAGLALILLASTLFGAGYVVIRLILG